MNEKPTPHSNLAIGGSLSNRDRSKREENKMRYETLVLERDSDHAPQTLDVDFLKTMSEIGALGLKKHGDHHYQTVSERPLGRNMIEHINGHLKSYTESRPHDDLVEQRYHLAAAAFNCMMEYYWFVRGK